MPELTPKDIAWKNRIESMLSEDVKTAKRILKEHGFTPEDALATVQSVSELGVSYLPKDGAHWSRICWSGRTPSAGPIISW